MSDSPKNMLREAADRLIQTAILHFTLQVRKGGKVTFLILTLKTRHRCCNL